MKQVSDLLQRSAPEWATHHYYHLLGELFSAEEVVLILAQADELEPHQSTLENHDRGKLRDSTLFWLPGSGASGWITERIAEQVHEWNRGFGFALTTALPRYCQLTRYEAGQEYGWHMDLGKGASSRRKISVVVGLNEPSEYEGGGTEIFYGSQANPLVKLSAGEALLFPSYVMHRAVPVTSGVRWTLVTWFSGERPLR